MASSGAAPRGGGRRATHTVQPPGHQRRAAIALERRRALWRRPRLMQGADRPLHSVCPSGACLSQPLPTLLSLICCQPVANLLPACCQPVARLWPTSRHHVANQLPIYCQRIPNLLPTCCQHVARLLPTCCQPIANLSPTYCQRIANQLPTCCRPVADLLPTLPATAEGKLSQPSQSITATPCAMPSGTMLPSSLKPHSATDTLANPIADAIANTFADRLPTLCQPPRSARPPSHLCPPRLCQAFVDGFCHVQWRVAGTRAVRHRSEMPTATTVDVTLGWTWAGPRIVPPPRPPRPARPSKT